jgi:hypothetical protein
MPIMVVLRDDRPPLDFVTRRAALRLFAGACLLPLCCTGEARAQMIHPMLVDVARYAVRARVAPAADLPWQSLQQDLAAALAEVLRPYTQQRPVVVLGPADPQVEDAGTLLLIVSARIIPAADMIPGSKGYLLAMQLQPQRRMNPGIPPVIPGTPFVVHAEQPAGLVAAARAAGTLESMLRDSLGLR